jgi:hypothetical protein
MLAPPKFLAFHNKTRPIQVSEEIVLPTLTGVNGSFS